MQVLHAATISTSMIITSTSECCLFPYYVQATRPDAKELIKLEQLVEGRGDVDECASSNNDILRKVAVFLRENDNTIPALVPSPVVEDMK